MKLKRMLICLLAMFMLSGVASVDVATVAQAATESSSTKDTKETKKKSKKKSKKKTKKSKKKNKKAKKSKAKKKSKTKTTYTKGQLRLLSCLIYCEAGIEPYAGKVAVGIVVLNRMNSKEFPDTMKKVVYQPYQFGPARNGSLKKALARYDAGKFNTKQDKQCIKAAKEALSGVKTVEYGGEKVNMKKFLYFSGYVSNAKYTLAGHMFK